MYIKLRVSSLLEGVTIELNLLCCHVVVIKIKITRASKSIEVFKITVFNRNEPVN